MARWILLLVLSTASTLRAGPPSLRVGFAAADITPEIAGKKKVWIAGFGKNRASTGVLDPIMARCVVLDDGGKRIALVSLDLVGLFYQETEKIRSRLPKFDHVQVTCTHNHEGPDTLGLWGPNFFTSGLDADYQARVVDTVVRTLEKAAADLHPVQARIGTIALPDLLHDGRLPQIKHDELVALVFRDAAGKERGIVVQWNCHPETLDSRNTLLSADYVAWTVRHLAEKHRCPVVYLTGTVGGLMTSLHVPVRDENGKPLADGTVEKTKRFGLLVGQAADRALAKAVPLKLIPFAVRTRQVYLPLDNNLYQLGWKLGVLKREAYAWKNDPYRADPLPEKPAPKQRLALRTEIGLLRLGELEIAAIPGEIYPELVLGKVQDPVDPGADFPEAPVEPALYAQMKAKHRLLVGLANDEIGYILPRRQWDEKAPFCYGRKTGQYGEVNSLGPETGPLLCEAFRRLAAEK